MLKTIYNAKHIKKIFAALFILIVIIVTCIVLTGLKDNLFKADLIVVLGSKVHPNGEPSLGLKVRLNRAIDIYQQKYAPLILVSGGTGKEGYNEALAMEQFLLKRGIPRSAIIKDPEGINTRATALNTHQYMKAHQLSSIIIVSQYYHIARTKLAFEQVGTPKIGSASANLFRMADLYSIVREIVGYPVYFFKIK